jgi:HK97 family phage prohead protease
MKRERRFLQEAVHVDLTESKSKKISGYAARFAPCRSQDLGGWYEEVDPKAFAKCLATNPDVRALWNHSADHVLGRTKSGTLQLGVTSEGLRYSIEPPDTQTAKDLMISLERGDVDQASFGFVTRKDSWKEELDGTIVRTLLEVDLFDVSPTTFGAYTDASSQVRSLFPDDKGHIPTEIQAKIAEVRSLGTSAEHSSAAKTEKRYSKIMSAVSGYKWAITPEKLETICALLDARANGQSATKEEIRAAMQAAHSDAPTGAQGVAVIPVYGVIAARMMMFDEFSGGTSCEAIQMAFRSALADDTVGTIVLDIDSPGGTVTGVPELAAEILAARGTKPVIAVANSMAASAAYWIASAADKIVVTPSGDVGSIGVYTTHQDVSAAMEKEGVKVTYIQAGKYKTDGNPYTPPSEEFLENTQKDVNTFYQMFLNAVAAGRGISAETVAETFGQGRMVMAQDAVACGMADEIATLEQVVGAVVTANADQMVGQPTDGMQADVTTVDDTCNCECESCSLGDCKDCTNDACDDPNCDCAEDTDPDTEDDMDFSGQAVVEGTPTALSEEQEWKETFALKLKLAKARISF